MRFSIRIWPKSAWQWLPFSVQAIELVIDAFEEALTKHPKNDHRHRIEHCQTATKAQLQRMAKLGVATWCCAAECPALVEQRHIQNASDLLEDGQKYGISEQVHDNSIMIYACLGTR